MSPLIHERAYSEAPQGKPDTMAVLEIYTSVLDVVLAVDSTVDSLGGDDSECSTLGRAAGTST